MPLWKKWNEKGACFAIWRVDETAEVLRSMLTSSIFPYDEELAGLKAESRKLEYLAVRVLLSVLCKQEKQIMHLPSGKPYLVDGSFHITISHTRGYVAVGLHPHQEVGIDIEYMSERVCKVVKHFMYPEEFNEATDTAYLLIHWSAKETMYKMLGVENVDFLKQLRVYPFQLQPEGVCEGQEFRTSRMIRFDLHYEVCSDFICTWCVSEDFPMEK